MAGPTSVNIISWMGRRAVATTPQVRAMTPRGGEAEEENAETVTDTGTGIGASPGLPLIGLEAGRGEGEDANTDTGVEQSDVHLY